MESPKANLQSPATKAAKTLTKTATAGKRPRSHPAYKDMVREAMLKSDQRLGASLPGICSYILTTYPSANKPAFRFHVRSTIARGLGSGALKRTKKTEDAHGSQGRFLVDKSKKPDKASKRSRSASPDRPRKVKKDTDGKAKAKGAAKVAKPRSRSTSPKKGKAKIKTTGVKKEASKSKSPAKKPKKATQKKASEKAGDKKAAGAKPKAATKKIAPKKKSTPKKASK